MNDDELTLTLLRKIETLENRIEYLEAVEKNVFSNITVNNRTITGGAVGQRAYKSIPDNAATDAFTLTQVGAGASGGNFLVSFVGSVSSSLFSSCYILSLAYNTTTFTRQTYIGYGMTSEASTTTLATGVVTINMTVDNNAGSSMPVYCHVVPISCWASDYWTLAAV